ncbi:unnamed protein product [Paramecium sonneborni]|uniref:Uncharacterized protein n=1 Tax=Paramecium sonneborni TaxID=65129 RepID=A0A8S1MXR9_9CILI|nr:unnamed protein product [Paramecium sonneborni]
MPKSVQHIVPYIQKIWKSITYWIFCELSCINQKQFSWLNIFINQIGIIIQNLIKTQEAFIGISNQFYYFPSKNIIKLDIERRESYQNEDFYFQTLLVLLGGWSIHTYRNVIFQIIAK